jgi:hypothetical protein
MPAIDVGLIARDKFSATPDALEALLQDLPTGTAIHLIDIGYPLDLLGALIDRAAGAGVALHRVPAPRFANTNTAWNRFVAATSGDVLVCVENDVRVQPGMLTELAEELARDRFDVVTPAVYEGAVGSAGKIHFDPPVSAFRAVDGRVRSELVRRPKPAHPRVDGIRRIDHVEKHCYALSRTAAERLGPLDEEMHCRTDLDLSLTCRARDLRIGIVPSVGAAFRKQPTMPADAELFAHRWSVEDAQRANERLVAKWRLVDYKSSVEFVHEMRRYLEEAAV